MSKRHKPPIDVAEVARRTKRLRQLPRPEIPGPTTAPAYLVCDGRYTPLAIVAVTNEPNEPCSQTSNA